MGSGQRFALWRSEQRRLLGYLDEVDPQLAQMAELMLLEDIERCLDYFRAHPITNPLSEAEAGGYHH